jgi:hypothetical protein
MRTLSPQTGYVHLLFQLVVHRHDFHLVPVQHEKEHFAFADMAGLEFADDDRAHIFTFLDIGIITGECTLQSTIGILSRCSRSEGPLQNHHRS